MLSGTWAENSGPIPTIQFESINSCILEKIIQYFYYKSKYDGTNPPLPPFKLDNENIVQLLLAANFLDT
jgi:transcription elongation factor B subunit 1